MLIVREITQSDAAKWNNFVQFHKESDYSHLYEWKNIFEKSYSLKTLYLGVYNNEELQAVLPMVIIKYPFLGKKAFSLPYLNYCGLIKTELSREDILLNKVLSYIKRFNLKSLELRKLDRLSLRTMGLCTLKLSLPNESTALWDGLKPKVRNQIRKAQKYGFSVKWGVEQIDQFFNIYSRNMHELGTPVHSKSFFTMIIKELGNSADILTIYKDKLAVASMFLIKYRRSLSDPWASSLKEYLQYCPNMLMYWEALKWGTENGFEEFDFGRSDYGSGTFKFKTQWGCSPVNLDYIVVPNLTDIKKPITSLYKNNKMKYLISIWRILPIPVANWLGPKLRKYVP